MNDSKIKITIVFPTFNAEKVIFKNLQSIQNLNHQYEIEIIIIDNNSLDSTKNIIKSFKNLNIKLIENDSDLGFARAINLGVPKASGEFIFITNDDVSFPKDFFNILLKIYNKFKKSREIIISPAVVFTGKYINYFGAKIHFLGFSYTPNMYEKMPKDKLTFKTLKIAGCSIFMKKEIFLKLKGFDSYFFMYHEDSDFSLRAIRNGIPIYTTNETMLNHQKIHMMINNFTYYYLERNRYLTIYKNFESIKNLIPFFIITEPMLVFQAIVTGMLILRLRIYKFFIQNYRQIRYLRFNKFNDKTKKLKKFYLDTDLDPIILGRLFGQIKFFKIFLKFVNLIL